MFSHDIHCLGAQPARVFQDFHRNPYFSNIVKQCAAHDLIQIVGIQIHPSSQFITDIRRGYGVGDRMPASKIDDVDQHFQVVRNLLLGKRASPGSKVKVIALSIYTL